jgi:meiotically up-regulated gene 157 (Mug157) protein
MAVFALDWLNELAKAIGDEELARQSFEMGNSLAKVLWDSAIVGTQKFGSIWVYETNGLGSCNLMDDANMPSLLSIPYIGGNIFANTRQTIWENTRRYALSDSNPFFFSGTAGAGMGSPHTGLDMIWPISICVQGLTSIDEAEMKKCLQTLQSCHAGTGFMHESFHKDNAAQYTRKWFAWANAMFAEFLLKMYRRKPHLLQ